MKFAVVGAGAVGCYYGGKLAAAAEDVHFLMRADLAQVRSSGLKVISDEEAFRLEKVNVHATSAEIGQCDAVLIALKTTSNEALEQLIPPLLHEQTCLLTLQNGLGNEEYLAERFGIERVLGGLCFVCLNRLEPGVIRHFGHGTLSIGEFGKPSSDRSREIVARFKTSGIASRAVDDLIGERWRKLVWNIPFNGLAIAAGGVTVDRILKDPALRNEARELMGEVIEAAHGAGHSIPASFMDEQIARSYSMGPYRPSSLIDYQAGRAVEVESIWGEPLRRATSAGVAVPRMRILHTLLRELTHNKKQA